MNVILLIIDTLRHDHVGANDNTWIRTPNMDRLAAESWAFDACFAASYPTIPHRTDVATGRYGGPFHGWAPLRFDALTLPRVLAAEGYCTQLIHDTPHLVNGGHNFDWPFHAWTFVRGAEVDRPWIDALSEWPENWARDPLFDFVDDAALNAANHTTYVSANRRRSRPEDWNAARLFLTACEWLRDNASRDNFFLWLDCFDPHEPWDVPPEFARLYDDDPDYDGRTDPRSFRARKVAQMSEAAAKRIRAHYAGKVSWVDRWLGNLLDTLEETGLARNTALILTADHGTNLGETGQFGKGWAPRENEAHVPMFVRHPDRDGGRSDMIVQPQDIFATVCGLAGVGVPPSIESYDVLKLAREGGEAHRAVALAGSPARLADGRGDTLFTVFDGDWCLEFTGTAEGCRLVRLGSQEDSAGASPDVVERLRAAAVEEIARRGADPALVAWLKKGGQAPLPDVPCLSENWPGPPGYDRYFSRLYDGP